MDPTKTKLIYADGEETVTSLRCAEGEPIPKVLIRAGIPGRMEPARVFAIDDSEIAKRFWQELVFRETAALFI